MLACIASTMLSSKISAASIYTMKLIRRGDLVPGSSESAILKHKKVKELMRQDTTIVKIDAHFREVLDAVLKNQHFHTYVVDENNKLVGRITLEILKDTMEQGELLDVIVIAEDVMIPVEYSVRVDTVLADCMQIFGISGLPDLPVLDDDGRIIGRICHGDLTNLYSSEIFQFGAFGPGFTVNSGDGADIKKMVKLDLPEGQTAESIMVRGKLAGMSIRELDLRKRFGVEVIGVRKCCTKGGVEIAPDPDEPLKEGSMLILVGSYHQIKQIKELELP